MIADRRAFSLIELLVALSVLGLIMVLVTRSLDFVATARERVSGHRQMAQSLGSGMRLVGSELSRALPLAKQTDDGPKLLFEGTSTVLRYVTATPAFEPGPAFTLWQLRLVADGEGQIIEAWRQRGELDELDPTAIADGAGRELLRTQIPLSFSYRRPAKGEEPAAWVQQWRDAKSMPQGVMLAATAGPGEAWPPWVVPLRIDQLFYCNQSYAGDVAEDACLREDDPEVAGASETTTDSPFSDDADFGNFGDIDEDGNEFSNDDSAFDEEDADFDLDDEP